MLQLFGVMPTTERVYQCMLDHPHAPVVELADLLGLTVDQITGELDRLAQLMLLEPDGDSSTAYLAVPPDQALTALLAREEQRLQEHAQQLARTRNTLSTYVDSFVEHRVKADGLGLVEQIDEAEVVRSRLFQLVRQAKDLAYFVLPGDGLPPAAIEPSKRLDDTLMARQVTMRMVVAGSSLRSDAWLEHLAAQAASGAQVRVHPAPPMKLIVFDAATAILPRADSPGAHILHGTDLVAPVLALTQEIWEQAKPLPSDDEVADRDTFSEARIRQVVLLLSQGLKDEAIARKMAVSVRTVRRLVSVAVESLQAESRFQAGAEAVRRGWVS